MALLASASFGRVGVSMQALPAILPVTIALMDTSVIFRTIAGTKLAYAAAGSVLAVEVDEYDASLGSGWSVLVRGTAAELVDPRDIARARELLADSWTSGESTDHFVGVSCDLVTGRRLRRPSPVPDSP